MGLYANSSFDLLCMQVNRDNPDLGVPFSRDTVMLLQGPLTTNLGTSKRNTRAIFNGIQGKGIVGKKEVFYDRLALNRLFAGSSFVVTAPADAVTVKDMLAPINAQLGIQLSEEDITNPNTAFGQSSQAGSFVITIAATSLSYTGTLSVNWRRAPVGVFPLSGPGTKTMLFGSLDAGYFGIVSTSEFMDEYGFQARLFKDETIVGTLITGTLFWMKFAYKGRFIFVPSRPLIYSLTWNDLYNLGVVYPFEQEAHQIAAGVTRVRQGKVFMVKEGSKTWKLKPRLPRLTPLDPIDGIKNGSVEWDSGEFWELYRHVHKLYSYGDASWADLGSQLALTNEEWLQNTRTGTPTTSFTQKFGLNGGTPVTKSGSSYYRPVLEIVNDREIIIPLEQQVYNIEGRLVQPIVNIVQDINPANRLQHVNGVTWEVAGIPAPTPSTVVVPLLHVSPISYATTDLPVPSVSYSIQ